MTTGAAPQAVPLALAARNIGVSFGGLRALDDVSIDVHAGAIVGIIGPNGAGKTTLFDCLSGLIPCEGRVWIGPREVGGLPPHERAAAGLGRSFQDARLFHSMTVLDTLRVASELHLRAASVMGAVLALPTARAAERAATDKALELIEVFGLGMFRDKLIRELSTGTRRIVDLAAVVAQRPSVVLLDEPSSGIAQREAEALGPLLRRLRDHTGCALVLIEHDMPLLLGLAERVYALETGRVIAVGKPERVVHHPEVVRSYLGADVAAIARSGAVPSEGVGDERAPADASAARRTRKPAAKGAAKPAPARKRAAKGVSSPGGARPATPKPRTASKRTKTPRTPAS